jgi:alkylhydroperoxidase/carboxymuconolactone decarboxylase family protein YurZ
MHLPPFLEKLQDIDPAWFSSAMNVQSVINQPGRLDLKTKLLILLAVDAFSGSSGVSPIANLARANGACEEEIKECLRIAGMIAQNRFLKTAMDAFP